MVKAGMVDEYALTPYEGDEAYTGGIVDDGAIVPTPEAGVGNHEDNIISENVSESDLLAEAAAQDRRDAVSAFVDEFITDNREYSEEAKDYFMKLIDSGSPISEVRFVARKNMSVENMEVLRRVYREKKG